MSSFQSRFERLELKYLVDEHQADAIRKEIEPFCVLDAHCRPGTGERAGARGYRIDSLYLDTPALAFHRAKERGDPHRVKLRVRTYSDSSPATFEVKRRRSNVIDKTRAVIDRELAEEAAAGATLSGVADGTTTFLRDFCQITATSGAQPTLYVRYEREAHESIVDDYVRVTFDRAIEVCPASDWSLHPDETAWHRFDDHWGAAHIDAPVVMEIKCQTSAIPTWVTDLIRHHDLVQTSFSKYSVGIHISSMMDGAEQFRSRSARALG